MCENFASGPSKDLCEISYWSARKPGVEENAEAVDDLSQSILPTLDIPQVRQE